MLIRILKIKYFINLLVIHIYTSANGFKKSRFKDVFVPHHSYFVLHYFSSHLKAQIKYKKCKL